MKEASNFHNNSRKDKGTSLSKHKEQLFLEHQLLSDDKHPMVEQVTQQATHIPADYIHEVFEKQVEQVPDAIAVVFKDDQLSYQTLNQRVNQLAHYLRARGVGPEIRVGLCLRRSLDMLIALLAILKSGGTYVPLDPTYPKNRLAFMIEDAHLQLVITEESSKTVLPNPPPCSFLYLDIESPSINSENQENPINELDMHNLAYIIYTSGSTGKPKGVLISHYGFLNLIKAQQHTFAIQPRDHILQFASISFDASISEIFITLTRGATLYLASVEDLLPVHPLLDTLHKYQISVVTLPPSILALLPSEPIVALRTIVVAGEACSADIVERWGKAYRFFNAYGPTEATVCTTIANFQKQHTHYSSIGQPIENVQVYLLDAYQQQVSTGEVGELCVGGFGLARGYLNYPDLTASKFIPHPFSSEAGARLYRTGDRARYFPDGNIEFLGRTDQQVKLRGFRIELGEIEVMLRKHPMVSDVAVIVREDKPGDKRLVAYVVLTGKQETTSISTLQNYINDYLPNYMIPSIFVVLKSMPLTSNGKIDREKLPFPKQVDTLVAEESPTTSQSQIERLVAGVWRQVLEVSQIGNHDNFFAIGGHSLTAIQVIVRLQEIFLIDIQLQSLFEAPTVAELSHTITAQIVEQLDSDILSKLETLPQDQVQSLLLTDRQTSEQE